MTAPVEYFDAGEECLGREALQALQLRKFREMAAQIAGNEFFSRKYESPGVVLTQIESLDALRALPFTTKAELVADQAEHPPYGTNLSYPQEQYTRVHATSGTTGSRLRWLDTPESWDWFMRCWGMIYRATGVMPEDRLLFAFSFGPFIGFWAAFEGAQRLGNFCLPTGGMNTSTRLAAIVEHSITVVCCTPTYALHMAQTAALEGIDLAASPVRALIVSGEPGGNVTEVRRQIENGWGARVFDHSGMTEIGSIAIECVETPGAMHLLESECIAEVIDASTLQSAAPGEEGELVLTNLGRFGSPLIRYRTGDRVRLDTGPCPCGRTFHRLDGGLLGRQDDMFFIKGNNVYPAAIENIVRELDGILEFQLRVRTKAGLNELEIEIEPHESHREQGAALADQLAAGIHDCLLFRPTVTIAQPGALPRFEMKARRLVKDET